jgi:hypothetical protein
MFVERSAGRIRFARTVFVLAGLLPCAALAAWAVHLRSTGHREALRLAWQREIGIPLQVDAVRHPRPGVVRAVGCRLLAPGGVGAVALPDVEIETAATEVRLRIDRFVCDAAAARLLGDLVREWLEREARYPRDCVVEIADFGWATLPTAVPSGLRVECVIRDGSRAVRAVRAAGPGVRQDEFRVVRTGSTADASERLEAEGDCAGPIPLAVAVAALGGDASAAGAATVAGQWHAVREDGRWSGSAEGRIDELDLANCTARLQARATGAATAVIRRLTWSGGRIRDAEIECTVGRGRVEQRLVDGLVSTVGCRPGSAHRTLSGAAERSFDAAGCVLRLDPRGIELLSGAKLGGALAVADGLSIVDPPAGILPPERLAWLLAPPGAVFVPSAGPGAWLLDVMPRADQAARPGTGGGF